MKCLDCAFFHNENSEFFDCFISDAKLPIYLAESEGCVYFQSIDGQTVGLQGLTAPEGSGHAAEPGSRDREAPVREEPGKAAPRPNQRGLFN